MSNAIKVGIAGAGSIAFGTAALLCENGHDPMLWSPSGEGTKELAGGAQLKAVGTLEVTCAPRIAEDAATLARDNDVLIIALPGYGHKTVLDALAPHIRNGQQVIISSHMSLGAVYLAGLLEARGLAVPITAWGTTAITGRRQSGAEVRVNTVRKLIDLCTVPEEMSGEALELCKSLFGDRFQPRDGLLAISLSNLNPQNHMGIALGNIVGSNIANIGLILGIAALLRPIPVHLRTLQREMPLMLAATVLVYLLARNGEIGRVAGIDTAQAGELTFFVNPRYTTALRSTRAAAVILADDAEPAHHLQRRRAQSLVMRIGQGQRRRDDDGFPSVDAHRVQILHRADDDRVVAAVAQHLELEFLPAEH